MGNAESSPKKAEALRQQAISRLGVALEKELELEKAAEERCSPPSAKISESYSSGTAEGSIAQRRLQMGDDSDNSSNSSNSFRSTRSNEKKRKAETKSAHTGNDSNNNGGGKKRRTVAKRSALNSKLLKEMANFKVIIPPELQEEASSNAIIGKSTHPQKVTEQRKNSSSPSNNNSTNYSAEGEEVKSLSREENELVTPPSLSTTKSGRVPKPSEKVVASLNVPAHAAATQAGPMYTKNSSFSAAGIPIGKMRGLPMASKKNGFTANTYEELGEEEQEEEGDDDVERPIGVGPGVFYQASSDPIKIPHEHDVLVGRGHGATKHSGNQVYRLLCENFHERYHYAPRFEKHKVAEAIIRQVRSRNPPGRFIEQEKDGSDYYEVSFRKAKDKICQNMRDGPPKGGKKKKSRSSQKTSPTLQDTVGPPRTVEQAAECTLIPHPHDVLLGRGNGVATWPGNQVFRSFCWDVRKEYYNAPRNGKGRVADMVIEKVNARQPPGRFLERQPKNGEYYTDVPRHRVREKICQALRERKWTGSAEKNFHSHQKPKKSAQPPPFLQNVASDQKPFPLPKKRRDPSHPSPPRPVANKPPNQYLGRIQRELFTTRALEIIDQMDLSDVNAELTRLGIDSSGSPHHVRGRYANHLVAMWLKNHAERAAGTAPQSGDTAFHATLSSAHSDGAGRMLVPAAQAPQAVGQPRMFPVCDPPNLDSRMKLDPDSRIAVYWPLDETYYNATVVERIQNFVFLKYDDEATEWLDLTKHTFKVLGANGGETAVATAPSVVQKANVTQQEPAERTQFQLNTTNAKKKSRPRVRMDGLPSIDDLKQLIRIPTPPPAQPLSRMSSLGAQIPPSMKSTSVVDSKPPPTEAFAQKKPCPSGYSSASAYGYPQTMYPPSHQQFQQPPSAPPLPAPAVEKGQESQQPQTTTNWTAEEEGLLVTAIQTCGTNCWHTVAEHVPGRSHIECRERYVSLLGPHRPLSEKECRSLLALASQFGYEWNQVIGRDHLNKTMQKEFPGRSLSFLAKCWQSEIHPAIKTYVIEKRTAYGAAIDASADITISEYEKDFEGILLAAVGSQVSSAKRIASDTL